MEGVILCTNDKNIWLDALDRTGFPLEYQTQQLLRNHGWNVINSRYYLDDKTGSEREVDIVAYKTRPAEGVLCCTYLMISCKKATKSSWVFLTSDNSSAEEDFDPCPLGIAVSDPGISRIIHTEKPLAAKLLLEMEPYRRICGAPHKILSFQQIHRESHRPEDDKRIFDSIITTIKAASYEKKYALAHRPKGENVCFDFHLLSVFEGGMKENYRSGSINEISDIPEIKYINRHIIGDTDQFHRVHFIDSSFFDEAIGQYDLAAEALPNYYAALCAEFYGGIFDGAKKDRMLPFWENFKNELFEEMFDERYGENDRDYYNNSWLTTYEMDAENQILVLYWDMSFISKPEESIVELNKNEPLCIRTAQKLNLYFHYTGLFKFALEPHPQFSR